MMTRLISLAVVTTLIVLLGIVFFQVVAPFLLPLFLAGVIAMMSRPMFGWFTTKLHGRKQLAAGVTTAVILMSVFVPLSVGITLGALELLHLGREAVLVPNWPARIENLRTSAWSSDMAEMLAPFLLEPEELAELDSISTKADDDAEASPENEEGEPSSEEEQAKIDEQRAKAAHMRVDLVEEKLSTAVKKSVRQIAEKTFGSLGATSGIAIGAIGRFAGAAISFVVFTIGLFFFLLDGPGLLRAAESLIPIPKVHQLELYLQFEQVVRAVVLSTFAAAFVQGLLTAIALSIGGFGPFVVVFLFASLAAMIPLAGTWLVWGPAAIWLFAEGHWAGAITLALFGMIVIGTADNFIRAYVLNGAAKLHPLLAFVSVIGGLQALGIWGVFIAPVIASCLYALMKIFNAELQDMSIDKTTERTFKESELATTNAESTQGESETTESESESATQQDVEDNVAGNSEKPKSVTEDIK
ncbi:AI-2E family transporter [Calycomorphotria hydatis]|nr:AI-2E family transporter [Calycomorphotria hydatis]